MNIFAAILMARIPAPKTVDVLAKLKDTEILKSLENFLEERQRYVQIIRHCFKAVPSFYF